MFREYIREVAVKYELFGEAHNVNNYPRDVMVTCEGEEQKIKKFIHELNALKEEKKLKRKGEPVINESEKMLIQINEIDVSFYDFEGFFDNFAVIRSADEAGERFDEAGHQLLALRAENKENFNSLDKKYGAVSKTLNSMDKKLGALEDIKTLLEKFVTK